MEKEQIVDTYPNCIEADCPSMLGLNTCYLLDMIYIIGGSDSHQDYSRVSYDVTSVDLKTGRVDEAADLLFAVNFPVAASSLDRIAVCGGKTEKTVLNKCQVYSPSKNE